MTRVQGWAGGHQFVQFVAVEDRVFDALHFQPTVDVNSCCSDHRGDYMGSHVIAAFPSTVKQSDFWSFRPQLLHCRLQCLIESHNHQTGVEETHVQTTLPCASERMYIRGHSSNTAATLESKNKGFKAG
jgi:hypothetical protein